MDDNKQIKVLLCAANGSEEIETVNILNTLVRSGIAVTLAKIFEKDENTNDLIIKCTRGLKIIADKSLDECKDELYELIVLPGGLKGAVNKNFKKENLANCEILIKMLKEQKNKNKWYAAICASPAIVFEPNGLLDNEKATCNPNFHDKLKEKLVLDKKVVVSNKCGNY